MTVPVCAAHSNFSICRFMNSFRYGLLSVLLAMPVLFMIGCGTVSPAADRTFVDRINQEMRKRDIVVDREKLTGKKQIYVVQSSRKDRGFLKEIQRNLKGRGFIVTSGPMEALAEESEFYLVYEDQWHWDIWMYPSRVKIAIHDTQTHGLLGSAEFKNSVYHTYAHPPEITDELLGRIFGESEGNCRLSEGRLFAKGESGRREDCSPHHPPSPGFRLR
jgi:hypothetical protein